jgi:hypothetical protein
MVYIIHIIGRHFCRIGGNFPSSSPFSHTPQGYRATFLIGDLVLQSFIPQPVVFFYSHTPIYSII